MFQIISFKEDGLANLALIKLCEDDSVRLLRSLNLMPKTACRVRNSERNGRSQTVALRQRPF